MVRGELWINTALFFFHICLFVFFFLFFVFLNLVFVLIWIICRALGLKINSTLFNFSSMFRPSSGSKLQNKLSCNFKLVYILTLISDWGGIPWGPYHRFFFFFFSYFATLSQEFLKRVQFSLFWWKKYPYKRVLKGDNPTPGNKHNSYLIFSQELKTKVLWNITWVWTRLIHSVHKK